LFNSHERRSSLMGSLPHSQFFFYAAWNFSKDLPCPSADQTT
jgi:hypothetical protein